MMMQGVFSGVPHGRAATASSQRGLYNFNAEKRLSRLPIHAWVAAYWAEVRQHALPQSTLSTMYEPPPVLTTIFMQRETGGVESWAGRDSHVQGEPNEAVEVEVWVECILS